ncbi:MAG: cupin domain-containing protein [Jatrophihabitantaceae bacterium]
MSFYPPPRPYPPQRYLGEGGEVSARSRPASASPELLTASGSVDYLATGASTNGDYGLYRWNMSADLSGPGPHFHRTMSESFYVLSGTIRLYDGSKWIDGHPGDFLHVPEGGVHGFRNESGEPASMLILFAPGAAREAYFEGLAELNRTGEKLSQEQLDEFYAAHDNFWV